MCLIEYNQIIVKLIISKLYYELVLILSTKIAFERTIAYHVMQASLLVKWIEQLANIILSN